MPLRALYNLYNRKTAEGDRGMPPLGFSSAKVSFAVLISTDGRLLDLIDLKSDDHPVTMQVPEQVVRTVGVSANFLCDNLNYVFGIDSKGKPERAKKCFDDFVSLHQDLLSDVDDSGARAVVNFYRNRTANTQEVEISDFLDSLSNGGNIVFRLDGDTCFIHERPAVRKVWEKHYLGKGSGVTGQCLITGEQAEISKIHLPVRGVRGAQSSGAAIVSFNKDAFESYGKKQNYNAPVSGRAASAYVTALNYLLSDRRDKIQVGEATTIFWAECKADLEENIFGSMMQPEDVSDDSTVNDQIKSILGSVRTGGKCDYERLGLDPGVGMYILGLSPNSARISVRFWYVNTFGRLTDNLLAHYRDMQIVRSKSSTYPEYPGIRRLLLETAVLGKAENIAPTLEGGLLRSILSGMSYPLSLYMSVLTRIRADGIINPIRAGIVKACLLRRAKQNKNIDKEVLSVSLNAESTNTPYLIGRLFAVLEKAQKEAIPNINATIKDKYYSSASTTPSAVFPYLIRLAQSHISTIRRINETYSRHYESLIGEILNNIQCFPKSLNTDDQGTFILGYYQQREDFFRSKEEKQN